MMVRLMVVVLALTLVSCEVELAPGGPLATAWPPFGETTDSLVALNDWTTARSQLEAAGSVVRAPYAPAWQVREWRSTHADMLEAWRRPAVHRDSLAEAMRAWRRARAASQHDSMSAAESFAAHAYAIRRATLGERHPLTARAALELGDVSFRLSRIGRADTLAAAAVPILQDAFGRHPDVALAHEQLGRNLKNYSGSDTRVQALGEYRTALSIRVRALGPDALEAASVHHEIGNLERLSGHPAAALSSFRLSLEARRRARGPVHDEVAATLSAMTILEATQSHWRSAESLATAMMAAMPPRGTPPMSRAFRNGVYGQVLRRGGRLELATRALHEAVELNERAWELSPRDEGAVVQSGMSLHAELALAYVQAQRPIEALAILERGTSRALRELLVGHDTLSAAIWFAGVQRTVRQGEALVSWLVPRFGTLGADDPAWAVVVRDTGGPLWIRLPLSVTPGPRRLAFYWNEIRSSAAWPVRVPKGTQTVALATVAGEAWFAPLLPALTGVSRVMVCSPDLCGGGPPGALADASGAWYGDHYTFGFAPSMTLFARARLRARPWKRSGAVVAIGNPHYPQVGAHPWAPLAGSAEELASVRLGFSHARILEGADASAATVRRMVATGTLANVALLHLAGHTLIDQIRPLETALVLAPDVPGARDSRLSAREIAEHWRLAADLVCLTGCRGAIGQSAAMQGSVGFQYALMRAGARSVLVSLWPVDDAAAAMLVREFYARLGAGATLTARAEALGDAQRAVRQWKDVAGRRPYAHPAYWAGFALIGDPD